MIMSSELQKRKRDESPNNRRKRKRQRLIFKVPAPSITYQSQNESSKQANNQIMQYASNSPESSVSPQTNRPSNCKQKRKKLSISSKLNEPHLSDWNGFITKCCNEYQIGKMECEVCSEFLCSNKECVDMRQCQICNFTSNRHKECNTNVFKFECIECKQQRIECNYCFKDCPYCYSQDMAKVCWQCQSESVHLKCSKCENEITFEHKSCFGIDGQSLFERCHEINCPHFICTQCQCIISKSKLCQKAKFVNCKMCDAGNQYFCHQHSHQHIYD